MRLSPSESSSSPANPPALLSAEPAATLSAVDPAPFTLPATEFRLLAEGLRQRAALLALLLSDLHGEQRTVRSGAIPSSLVQAHPSIGPGSLPSAPALGMYAADLMRGPDGVWCILADHTGDALERGPVPRDSSRTANPAAAAALEAPALAAVIPSACRCLMGESLRLPSIPTLWFGDPGAIAKVAATYRRWAVRPAFDPAPDPVPLAGLSVAERIALHEAVTAEPRRFVASLAMPNSAQSVVVRLFLLRDGADWQVLPHCIARLLPPGLQPGGALPAHHPHKDVWIVG